MAESASEKEIDEQYELPEGWVWTHIPFISTNHDRKRIPVKDKDRQKMKGVYPYYGASGIIDHVNDYLFDGEYLLIGEDGANLVSRTTQIAFKASGKFWVNNHAHVLKIKGGIPIEFVEGYINRTDLIPYVTGSAQPKLTQKKLDFIPIPLPPLPEQHRIVAKLEALLAQVNRSKDILAKVPPLIKRFRQSVLAAACSGRLTEDWRREHPYVEPARKIIEAISQRRLKQANTPTKKQKIKDIHSHREEQDSDLLPQSWEYVAIDKLCESFQYGTSKKSMPVGKILVLRMGNIQNGEIDWNDLVYTSDEAEIEKYRLEPETVLFNRTNSPELVGKTAIYRGENPAIFAGYLIRINNYNELDSEYLNYCLNATYTKERCLKVKTDGVSKSNINAQKLGKFEITFCPLEEQQEIVRRVDVLFNNSGSIEDHYKKANAQVDNLTQSILARAFRGELVPQDPRDEPASVLLERIKQERAKNEMEKKTGKRKAKTRLDYC